MASCYNDPVILTDTTSRVCYVGVPIPLSDPVAYPVVTLFDASGINAPKSELYNVTVVNRSDCKLLVAGVGVNTPSGDTSIVVDEGASTIMPAYGSALQGGVNKITITPSLSSGQIPQVVAATVFVQQVFNSAIFSTL
jgi:hypothetical protein